MTHKELIELIQANVLRLNALLERSRLGAGFDESACREIAASLTELCKTETDDDDEPDYFVCDGCHG